MLQISQFNLSTFINNNPEIEKAGIDELSELEKGKKMPIGTVSNGMKKVAEGKWVPEKSASSKSNKLDHKTNRKSYDEIIKMGYGSKIVVEGEKDNNFYSDVDYSKMLEKFKKQKDKKESYKNANNGLGGEADKHGFDKHKPKAKQNIASMEKQVSGYLNMPEYKKYKEAKSIHDNWGKVNHTNKGGYDNAQRVLANATTAYKNALKKKLNITKSQNSSIEVDKYPTLQKSHIIHQFGHADNIQINKKGSEIKQNLESHKTKEMLAASKAQAEMVNIKEKVNCEPTEDPDSYIADGIDVAIMPKKYPWSECYSENESDETAKLKNKYNQCASKFIECQVECAMIDTMLKNIEDNKTYNLTVKQATILGF